MRRSRISGRRLASMSVSADGTAVAVAEEAADDTPFGTLLHFRKDHAAPAAARPAGRADVGPFRHSAAQHRAGDAARPRCLHHRLEERARCAAVRRALRPRRVRRSHHPLPARDGSGRHVVAVCQPAVPALAAAAVMAEAGDPAHAAQHDPDGGADRHAGQSDQGQRTRTIAADRMVRAALDRRGALALSGRVPPCLSGIRAARRVHEHEPGPAHQRASRPVSQPGRRRSGQRGGASASSTTNTAR